MITENIGGLRTLIAGDRSKIGVVVFHGYGASAKDLYSLHRLDTKNFCWYFPDGPITVDLLPGITGKAWFEIDVESLMMQVARKDDAAFEQGFPPNIDELRSVLASFLQELNIPYSRMILGGFSQGGVLATELGLTLPEKLRGLLLLSTTLVHKERLQKLKPQTTTFFQSHGRNDQILPFYRAERLTQLLQDLGLQGSLHAFDGGHELPSDILSQMSQYLYELK